MVNGQDLPTTLAKARQQLQIAQAHVAALEMQSVGTPQLYPPRFETDSIQLEAYVQTQIAELYAAKERAEALLNNSTDGILLVSLDLHIQQTNTTFNALLGCTPEAYKGQPLAALIDEKEAEAVVQRLRMTIAKAEEKHISIRAKRLDGTLFDAELSVGLMKDHRIVCTLRDSSHRKAKEATVHQSEQQLWESQKMLQLVLDTIPVRVFWKNRDSIIMGCNRVFAQDAGFDNTNDLIGKGHHDLPTLALEAKRYRDDDMAIIETGVPKLECEETLTLPEHGTLWIESSKLPLRDEEGEIIGLLGIYTDITARKQTEAALQQSAAEIHDLYNHAPCGYHSIDQEGTIVQINDTELRWLGYERHEIIHKLKLTDLLTPESVLVFQESFPLFKTRGWINDVELDLRCKDGRIIHGLINSTAIYDEHGQFLKSRTSLFDMTELKETQHALIKSEARYRLLAENVTDVISKVDSAGIRTFITPSCYALLGYRPEELLGRPAAEIVHPDDSLTTQALIYQAADATKSTPTFTQRLRHKTGHYLWVEVTASFIRDPATGEPREMISVMRNITERKRSEAMLAARLDEERTFQGYLKELHEITIELTQIDELDLFYQRAVKLGLTRLGFERFALFRYDAAEDKALGTYGTDVQGQIINEEHICFIPSEHDILRHAFMRTERFYFAENVPLYQNEEEIGIGWNAATLLWNDNQPLGWLVADNLLQQKPASKPQLDALGLYGLTVGTLLTQKQIQLALRASEARYRLLTENITDVVIRFTTSNEYSYVSPSSYPVLGYEPAELIGKSALTHIHPDDLSMIEHALAIAVSQNAQKSRMVIRFQHKQGHYLWLEASGQVIYHEKNGALEGLIVSVRDISDQKRAEAALKKSEENYRLLIENMRSGLVVYDIDARVTYVNDRICAMVGYTRDELIGTCAYHHPDPNAVITIKAQIEQRRRLLSSSYELILNHKDGSPVHLLVSASPLVDKYGAYSGSLAVMTDITVQKQAEEALRQALAKEKELGELKSRFVSMASHEFRTPLATILALTETLSAYRQRLTEEQIDQRFNKIKEQIHHLKVIMEDVLLLSRFQAQRVEFNPVELDLDLLCRTILDEFQSFGDGSRPLHYSRSGQLHTAQVDQKLMRQIISNLVSNAIKYSPAHKPIQVSLDFTEEIFILRVQDEGIGIPPADLKHLFEPFHRAANVGTVSGTGLGMVITKEAVELHGGTITIKSQLDQGTTCILHIPVHTKRA